MRVLLIEDDHTAAHEISLHLRAEGFECEIANNAARGISMATCNEYDAVVLDLELPDVSEHEVVTQIRSSQTVHILVLCEDCSVDAKIKWLVRGADDCLAKPFNAREIVARLRATGRHLLHSTK